MRKTFLPRDVYLDGQYDRLFFLRKMYQITFFTLISQIASALA